MSENSTVALAFLAAIGLATGASAQEEDDPGWRFYSSGVATYASEIFGEGAASLKIKTEKKGITVAALVLELPEEVRKSYDGAFEVTYTLHGAAFGDSVSLVDFESHLTNPQLPGVLKPSGKKDGLSGDKSVTVTFKPDSAIDVMGFPGARRLFLGFRLPALEGAERLATPTDTDEGRHPFYKGRHPVYISAEVSVSEMASAGNDSFPENVVFYGEEMPSDFGAPVAKSAQAFTFTGSDGAGGAISLEDRTELHEHDKAVSLGGLSLGTATERPLGADGMPFTTDDSGAGQINITVKGGFNEGDTVFFDQDGDGKVGGKETLDVDGGIAEGSFGFDDAFLDADGVQVDSSRILYYVPAGKENLTRGVYRTEFGIEYDRPSHVIPKEQQATARLEYAGVRVYAIIPKPATDAKTRMRIWCDAPQGCTVFLACDAQTGMRYFGALSGTIDSGAREELEAEDIANILGADDGWDGLLSCEVLSTGEASVQVLVRSADSPYYF